MSAPDPYLTRNLITDEPELADAMRSKLQQWWDFYAGTPGALPDPMQITLQNGPILYNQPEQFMEHLRATGRADQAEDLHRRLHPDNGALGASWTAQGPLMNPEERALFQRFFDAAKADGSWENKDNAAMLTRLLGVRDTASQRTGA